MTSSDYKTLLAQLYDQLGVLDAQTLGDKGALCVEGINLVLRHDENATPHTLCARLHMGPAMPEKKEWIWYCLLVSNFLWGGNGTVCWGLSPSGNRVILTVQCPTYAMTSGKALAHWLRTIVACAKEYWPALSTGCPVTKLPSLLPLQHALSRTAAMDHSVGCWRQLVGALCEHVGLEKPDPLQDGSVSLKVRGVDMLLEHNRTVADHFEIRLDLGMNTGLRREQLWQGLLWNNFLTGIDGIVTLSVHPDRDAVVMSMQQDMPTDANAPDLAELLVAIAGDASNFWAETNAALFRVETALREREKHTGHGTGRWAASTS